MAGICGASYERLKRIRAKLGPARKKPVLIVVLLAFSLALVMYSFVDDVAQLRIATPLLGLLAFIYTPVLIALVSEIAGVQRAGTVIGITNAVWQLGSVIVPIVIGLVFSVTGSFAAAFLTLAAGPLIAALLVIPVRYKVV